MILEFVSVGNLFWSVVMLFSVVVTCVLLYAPLSTFPVVVGSEYIGCWLSSYIISVGCSLYT